MIREEKKISLNIRKNTWTFLSCQRGFGFFKKKISDSDENSCVQLLGLQDCLPWCITLSRWPRPWAWFPTIQTHLFFPHSFTRMYKKINFNYIIPSLTMIIYCVFYLIFNIIVFNRVNDIRREGNACKAAILLTPIPSPIPLYIHKQERSIRQSFSLHPTSFAHMFLYITLRFLEYSGNFFLENFKLKIKFSKYFYFQKWKWIFFFKMENKSVKNRNSSIFFCKNYLSYPTIIFYSSGTK